MSLWSRYERMIKIKLLIIQNNFNGLRRIVFNKPSSLKSAFEFGIKRIEMLKPFSFDGGIAI